MSCCRYMTLDTPTSCQKYAKLRVLLIIANINIAPFRYVQKSHERKNVQQDGSSAAAKHSRREDISLPESEPAAAVDFGFGSGSPNMFSSGNDLTRKNVDQMKKISDNFGFGGFDFGVNHDPFANAVHKTDRVNHWYFDNVPKRSAVPPKEPEQRARTVEEHTTLRAFTEPQAQLKFGPKVIKPE